MDIKVEKRDEYKRESKQCNINRIKIFMRMCENIRINPLYITNIKLLNIFIIKLKSNDQENESYQCEGLALICYNKCIG